MKKVSIIIPVYNEMGTILEIIKRVENIRLNLEKEIIIVDDRSTDGTSDILKSLDKNKYKVVLKNKNGGKGSAVKAGIAVVTGDFVIFQDADLEYDPTDYPVLLAPLLTGEAEMVIGSRILSGAIRLFGKQRAHFASYFGCHVIAFMINLLYNRKFTDYYGCYKAFNREILKSVTIEANGFEYDSELLCKLLKKKIRVVEVPTAYYPRDHSKGKKLSFWRDSFRVIFSIIKWRFYN